MWTSQQENADLVTFNKEIPNKKLPFFCEVNLLSSTTVTGK